MPRKPKYWDEKLHDRDKLVIIRHLSRYYRLTDGLISHMLHGPYTNVTESDVGDWRAGLNTSRPLKEGNLIDLDVLSERLKRIVGCVETLIGADLALPSTVGALIEAKGVIPMFGESIADFMHDSKWSQVERALKMLQNSTSPLRG